MTEKQQPVIITYWHDDDVDTVRTVCFATDADADEFESFLDKMNFNELNREYLKIVSSKEAINEWSNERS